MRPERSIRRDCDVCQWWDAGQPPQQPTRPQAGARLSGRDVARTRASVPSMVREQVHQGSAGARGDQLRCDRFCPCDIYQIPDPGIGSSIRGPEWFLGDARGALRLVRCLCSVSRSACHHASGLPRRAAPWRCRLRGGVHRPDCTSRASWSCASVVVYDAARPAAAADAPAGSQLRA
jgi:hypothetical protein